jgi:hypothetical protein
VTLKPSTDPAYRAGVHAATRLALGAALITGSMVAVSGRTAAGQDPVPASPEVPVTLTLGIAGDQRQFRPGEIIPVELTFRSDAPGRFALDTRSFNLRGDFAVDTFRIEPLDGVSDPLLDYYASAILVGSGIGSTSRLGTQPRGVQLELNEWFRFDTAGVYTVSVRSKRVLDLSLQNVWPAVTVQSNPVSLEILPFDQSWEQAEIDQALGLLATGRGDDHREGCRILRFLGTPLAAREIVRRLERDRTCDFDFKAGLFTATDRRDVVRQLEDGLRRPDPRISREYLRTLAVLSIYADRPELRPAQTPEVMGGWPSGPLARQPTLVVEAMDRYAEAAAASLPDKSGDARAVTLAELIEYARSAPATPGIDAEALRTQLAGVVDALPAYRLRDLLGFRWPEMAHPGMLPGLRRMADGSDETADLALRRLYELDPDDGRARILDQVRNPPRHATLQTLGVLPDRELPALDDTLASNVESGLTDLRMALLQRYASPAVVPRVLAWLDHRIGRLACESQTHAVAYLLRASPADGATLLGRVLASRAETGCYQFVLHQVAALLMTPELEAAAIAHLDDPHRRVVLSGITTLGRAGSASARAPLRDRFERWRDTWNGREDELRGSLAVLDAAALSAGMQRQIESAYLNALGTGLGWWTGIPGLEDLRDLCVTDDCRREAESLLARAGSNAITVQASAGPSGFAIRVGQYTLDSLDALRTKISQYPRGTMFTLNLEGFGPGRATRLAAEIAASAATAGQVVTP